MYCESVSRLDRERTIGFKNGERWKHRQDGAAATRSTYHFTHPGSTSTRCISFASCPELVIFALRKKYKSGPTLEMCAEYRKWLKLLMKKLVLCSISLFMSIKRLFELCISIQFSQWSRHAASAGSPIARQSKCKNPFLLAISSSILTSTSRKNKHIYFLSMGAAT